MVNVRIRGTGVWGECEPVREKEGTIDPKECDGKCVSQNEVANSCQLRAKSSQKVISPSRCS
jgi:hypothetical protein